jgi:hypothetical protein
MLKYILDTYQRALLTICCGIAFTSAGFGQMTIYVDTGSFSSPYYRFYSNSGLTQPLNIYTGGADSLLIGQTYTFTGGSGSHPFYLSNLGVSTAPSALISLSGDGSVTSGITNSQSFMLSFNGFNPSVDTLTYFCTSHSSMNGTFNVVPEPSMALMVVVGGVVGAGLFRSRRRAVATRRS